jgi:hypothetical protein
MTIGVDPIYRMKDGRPYVAGYRVVQQYATRAGEPYVFHVLACRATAVEARKRAAEYAKPFGAKAT